MLCGCQCDYFGLVRTAAPPPDFYYSLQAILEVAAGQVQAEIAVTVLQAAPLWTGHVDAVARLHLSCPPGRFL